MTVKLIQGLMQGDVLVCTSLPESGFWRDKFKFNIGATVEVINVRLSIVTGKHREITMEKVTIQRGYAKAEIANTKNGWIKHFELLTKDEDMKQDTTLTVSKAEPEQSNYKFEFTTSQAFSTKEVFGDVCRKTPIGIARNVDTGECIVAVDGSYLHADPDLMIAYDGQLGYGYGIFCLELEDLSPFLERVRSINRSTGVERTFEVSITS